MLDSLFTVLLLTGALAEATRKKRAVTLEGNVAGLPDGVVELKNQTGIVTTSKLIDGKFSLNFHAAFPYDYVLLFENKYPVPVVIEKDYVYTDIDFCDPLPSVEINQFSQKRMLPVPLETK